MKSKVHYPAESCPFGAHGFRWWFNGLGISCWLCHKTWAKVGDGFIPTWWP